ncbi:hypothetical protein Taro_039632 [Colocasia esculenta]|uniref:Uncharacterized protein n=1 Tax=Colocasia esculenta TaxID=4460 RepID=A0A843W9U0_COLES|nr:hypothetical protein [Colocasia esculenta]
MTRCRCPHRFPFLLQVRDLSTPAAWRTPSNRRAGLGVSDKPSSAEHREKENWCGNHHRNNIAGL